MKYRCSQPTGVYIYFDSDEQARAHLAARGFKPTGGGNGLWDFAHSTVEARIDRDKYGTFIEYRGDYACGRVVR